MPYNYRNTYLIMDNRVIVYSEDEFPEKRFFLYNILGICELILIPILSSCLLKGPLGGGSFSNMMIAMFIGFSTAFIVIFLTSICPRAYIINKFKDTHYYRTFEVDEEDMDKLRNIKEGLRFEIAELLLELKAHPSNKKKEELNKMVDERFEMSKLVNRY